MKKFAVLAQVIFFGVALMAQTQTSSSAREQALMSLEQKWVDALAKADIATLNAVLADTYWDTDEHGQRTDKNGVLTVLKSGDLKIQSIKLSGMKVHLYGEAGVVIGTGEQVGNFRGEALIPKIVFTDTFVKENGKWRAVASHRTASP